MSDEFVVNDKRLFSKDGQVNPEAAKDEPAAPAAESGPGFQSADYMELPPANFAGLLVGLATSAFIHLGENPDPGSPQGPPDLPAAKHAIDLLAVLKEKTKGNLEPEEEALLQTLLYDLRLKYVKASPKK
ncbi:DUF1844 domain-containing protein [Deltaproteobacteria bacterium OttesenSCG-928-M10]|nr:DUF1844 domain-containing protein [Deltaproteobacteria bacterium OttesenSCG-928-M10]